MQLVALTSNYVKPSKRMNRRVAQKNKEVSDLIKTLKIELAKLRIKRSKKDGKVKPDFEDDWFD
jgi:ribosome-interacting GTPase 1